MNESGQRLIVVNPAAGKAEYESRLAYLREQLEKQQILHEVFFTKENVRGDLRQFYSTRPAIGEVIIMGGDGTVNYVVNELRNKKIPFSIVSNGTGNDSVKSLHGEMDFKKQVEIALHGKIKHFDLGVCNDRYFVNGVGVGFDGEVVREMVKKGNKRGGHLDYLLTVLRIVGGYKEKILGFSLDGQWHERRILLMTISNGTTFGGGFIINPDAKTDDGKLNVCIFNELKPIMRFWHLPKLKSGSHGKVKEVEFHLASEIVVESEEDVVAHLDGEYIGHPPFRISIEPLAFALKCPV